MTLARGFNTRLARAFPEHEPRVRWSDARESWQLEKKIHRARTVNPDKYPSEAVDSFIRFRDGYELIEEYAPRELPVLDKLIAGLRRGSVTRLMAELGIHTAGQLADAYDARDRRRAEEQRARRNRMASEHAGELYDAIAWDEGRRVSVPQNLPVS